GPTPARRRAGPHPGPTGPAPPRTAPRPAATAPTRPAPPPCPRRAGRRRASARRPGATPRPARPTPGRRTAASPAIGTPSTAGRGRGALYCRHTGRETLAAATAVPVWPGWTALDGGVAGGVALMKPV